MSERLHVFLTGASAGIGLEIAKRLTADGHEVWGTSRDAGRLPRLDRFHAVALDLNRTESIRAAVDQVRREAGHIDVLINNAGAGVYAPLEALAEKEMAQQFQLLVFGPMELVRFFLPEMRRRQNGLILNVASLAARFPIPFLGAYSASKAALSSLTECLRLELAHTPVRVVDLQPGDFNTPFHEGTRRLTCDFEKDYEPALTTVWKTIDRNMAAAPHPRRVADMVADLVGKANPAPVVAVGNLFQARIAPLLMRLGPRRWVQWGIRAFYGI
jgi:short-subunit dehydrogenase